MLRSTLALALVFPVALSVAFTCSCSAPPPAKAPAPAASAPPVIASAPLPTPAPPVEAAAAKPAPVESPGFQEALALLRPPTAEAAVQALIKAPGEAEPYAQAALGYASTNVPGMALLWGMSYQAMGGGTSDAAVAAALAKVLNERIVAKPDEHNQVTFNVRLAPGQMPTRQEVDGSVHAPVAHAFEALFSPAITGFRPPWTIEQFYDVLSTWTALVATQGTPLDAQVPLDGWLVVAAKAEHLEAFCYQLLGPAFPQELKAYKAKDAKALKAYRDFVRGSPLSPAHAALPDELVRIK